MKAQGAAQRVMLPARCDDCCVTRDFRTALFIVDWHTLRDRPHTLYRWSSAGTDALPPVPNSSLARKQATRTTSMTGLSRHLALLVSFINTPPRTDYVRLRIASHAFLVRSTSRGCQSLPQGRRALARLADEYLIVTSKASSLLSSVASFGSQTGSRLAWSKV